MENIKKWITAFCYAVFYVCMLVVVLSWTFVVVMGGIEAVYWIVTGTFFHFIPLC